MDSATKKYSALALGWFVAIPIIGIILEQYDMRIERVPGSILWSGGLCVLFYSWARLDAQRHNVSMRTVYWFTLAWILLPIVIVFPYLTYSRGWRNGLIASAKYFLLILASWMSLSAILGVFNFMQVGKVVGT